MKKLKSIIIFSILVLSLFFVGCTTQNIKQGEIPVIVTTFYPVQEITKAIVLNTTDVKTLIPIATDPHDFEPTPKQIVDLSNADVFVSMGGMFKHIENKVIESNSHLKIIQATQNITRIERVDANNSKTIDPHLWMSVKNMIKMTKTIENNLIKIYPDKKEFYQVNAQNYIQKLNKLESDFNTKLSNCSKHTILVNHKAFGYIGKDYNFKQISLAGFTPEVEPTPKTMVNLIDIAEKDNLKYIFSEGQMDKKTINTIANEMNVTVLELNPIKRFENETYISIQEDNVKKLAIGLECK